MKEIETLTKQEEQACKSRIQNLNKDYEVQLSALEKEFERKKKELFYKKEEKIAKSKEEMKSRIEQLVINVK